MFIKVIRLILVLFFFLSIIPCPYASHEKVIDRALKCRKLGAFTRIAHYVYADKEIFKQHVLDINTMKKKEAGVFNLLKIKNTSFRVKTICFGMLRIF